MSLKRCGAGTIGAWVDGNIEQAKHLYELVTKSEDFRAATEPRMSAICIRYQPPRPMNEEMLGRSRRRFSKRNGGSAFASVPAPTPRKLDDSQE